MVAMNLPSGFRRFLRQIKRYAAPVGAGTVLRGCPCPPAEFHPPAPYTSSIAVDGTTTLDANFSSWEPFCQEKCGMASSECYVRVNTSDGNTMQLATQCNDDTYAHQTSLSTNTTPWLDVCKKTCGAEQDCLIGPDATQNNTVMINCVSWWADCVGGRSTEGISVADGSKEKSFGAWLGRMATLEAESIPAFRRLKHELAALGAPRKLQRRAARSRRDEKRHTRTISNLARRHGGEPAKIINADERLALRSLEEVALENAVEGCIRETYGAWQAFTQSRESADPEFRAIMARIAKDEMRHAALAWEIHVWAMKRLDRAQQTHITRVMHFTWQRLVAQAPGIMNEIKP